MARGGLETGERGRRARGVLRSRERMKRREWMSRRGGGEETRRESQREEEECGVLCFVRPASLLCLPFRSPRPTPTALSSTDDYLLLYACVPLNRPPLLSSFLYVPDPSTPSLLLLPSFPALKLARQMKSD